MKLNMEKFESKRQAMLEKAFKPEVTHSIWMIVLNVICVCIGVYVAYYMYIRAGIVDPLGLVAFILGITLAVIGFERTFSSIADLIVVFKKKKESKNNASDFMGFVKVNMVNGLGTDTKALTVNILSEGIELKYSSFTDSEYVLPYDYVYKVLINKSLGSIYLFFMNVPSDYNFKTGVVNGFPYGGVVLNDLFDGFDWDDVLSKLKYHLESDRFVEVDATEEKMNTLVWNNMLVGAFLQEGIKDESQELVADPESEKEESTEGIEAEIQEEPAEGVVTEEEAKKVIEEIIREETPEEASKEDEKEESVEGAEESKDSETSEEGKSDTSEEESATKDMQEDETTSLEEESENTEKAEEEKKQ